MQLATTSPAGQPQKNKAGFYLPNLDSLRAIAAIMVIVSHIAQYQQTLFSKIEVHLVGRMGVIVFFTLSGFLITYLLLKEKSEASNINVKAFYLRRILRIWPLYFLILFLVYVVLHWGFPEIASLSSSQTHFTSILLNIFFLTNVTFILKLTPFIITPIWSIGIEEQFYIFWPWIVKQTKVWAIRLIIGVMLFMPLIRLAANVCGSVFHIEALQTASRIFATTKFDQMAFGGLMAYVGFNKKIHFGKFILHLEWIQKKNVQLIAILMFFVLFWMILIKTFNPEILFYPLCYSVGIIICNLALNPQTTLSIETRIGNYLGKISFGLYLCHMPIIYIANHLLKHFYQNMHGLAAYFVPYIVILPATIAVAAISYHFWEMPFLKLKHKFSYQTKSNGK